MTNVKPLTRLARVAAFDGLEENSILCETFTAQFSCPKDDESNGRMIKLGDKYVDLWSPNSKYTRPYFPGLPNAEFDVLSTPPSHPNYIRRVDGSLGRFDFSLYPQILSRSKPWRAMVSKPVSETFTKAPHYHETSEVFSLLSVWVTNPKDRYVGHLVPEWVEIFQARVADLNRNVTSVILPSNHPNKDILNRYITNRPRLITKDEMRYITLVKMDFDQALDNVTWALRRAREMDAFLRFFQEMCDHSANFRPSGKLYQGADPYIGFWGNGDYGRLVEFLSMHLRVPLYLEYLFTVGHDYLPECDTASATASQRLRDGRRNVYTFNLEGSDEFRYPTELISIAREENWPTMPIANARLGMPPSDALFGAPPSRASLGNMGLTLKREERPLKEPPQPAYSLPPPTPQTHSWPNQQEVKWTGMARNPEDRRFEGWLISRAGSTHMEPPAIMHAPMGSGDRQWDVYIQESLFGEDVTCRMSFSCSYHQLKKSEEDDCDSDEEDLSLRLFDRQNCRILIYVHPYKFPDVYQHSVVPFGQPLPEFEYWKQGRLQTSSRWAYRTQQNTTRVDPSERLQQNYNNDANEISPPVLLDDSEYSTVINPPPAYQRNNGHDSTPSTSSTACQPFLPHEGSSVVQPLRDVILSSTPEGRAFTEFNTHQVTPPPTYLQSGALPDGATTGNSENPIIQSPTEYDASQRGISAGSTLPALPLNHHSPPVDVAPTIASLASTVTVTERSAPAADDDVDMLDWTFTPSIRQVSLPHSPVPPVLSVSHRPMAAEDSRAGPSTMVGDMLGESLSGVSALEQPHLPQCEAEVLPMHSPMVTESLVVTPSAEIGTTSHLLGEDLLRPTSCEEPRFAQHEAQMSATAVQNTITTSTPQQLFTSLLTPTPTPSRFLSLQANGMTTAIVSALLLGNATAVGIRPPIRTDSVLYQGTSGFIVEFESFPIAAAHLWQLRESLNMNAALLSTEMFNLLRESSTSHAVHVPLVLQNLSDEHRTTSTRLTSEKRQHTLELEDGEVVENDRPTSDVPKKRKTTRGTKGGKKVQLRKRMAAEAASMMSLQNQNPPPPPPPPSGAILVG